MAKLSLNDFLTVEEIAKFLEDINPAISSIKILDYKVNFFEILKDFLRQNNITPVFYYDGNVSYHDYKLTTFGLISNKSINQNGIFRGYLIANSMQYEKLLDKDLIPQSLDGLYQPYKIDFNSYTGQFSHCRIYGRDTITNQPNKFLTITELRFPKIQIEAFLKNKKISIKQDNNTISNSMFCLIAILKNLLLDKNIGAFHFKFDGEKSSNKPSQEGLIAYISDMKIKNLSENTIKKIFPKANQKLRVDSNEQATINSAFCLIGILKDFLLDADLAATHFTTNNDNNIQSQEKLISYIGDMNIKSLNLDIMENLFDESDKKLEEFKLR